MLQVSHLSKQFGGSAGVLALDDFSLEVEGGEFVAVVGPSGCGKSTLLHIIAGFDAPTSGSVRLDGGAVTRPGPDRGMLFQDYALFPWRTVLGNVTWGLEVKGLPRAERLAVADAYLRLVGLNRFRDHYPAQLSGGMKQRVALARVLAYGPQVLLMDEPLGALDAQTRELMQEELQRIWQEERKTVLLITHDIDEAIYLADRVIVFTARPGRKKAEIRIDLPRPREAAVRAGEPFARYHAQIWTLLRDEVLRSAEHMEA